MIMSPDQKTNWPAFVAAIMTKLGETMISIDQADLDATHNASTGLLWSNDGTKVVFQVCEYHSDDPKLPL